MLAKCVELNFGMSLLREAQIVGRGEQVGEGIHTVERKLGLVFVHKLAHGGFIVAQGTPAEVAAKRGKSVEDIFN